MDNTFDYINIREVLSRLTRNTLLKDLNIEALILYTVDFIRIVGLNQSYQIKESVIHIDNYKALLPCDLVSVNLVKDLKSQICLRGMTNTFNPKDIHNNYNNKLYCCGHANINMSPEFTYKTLNRIIFCGLKECDLELNYNAIAVDDDGFPLLIDDPLWINTLELYVKQLIYSDLFDLQKISLQSLINAQTQYAFRVGLLTNRYSIPTYDLMESIKNAWTSLIQTNTYHSNGFKDMSKQELIINH